MTDETANSDERRQSPRDPERVAPGNLFGEEKEGVAAGDDKPWLALRGRPPSRGYPQRLPASRRHGWATSVGPRADGVACRREP